MKKVLIFTIVLVLLCLTGCGMNMNNVTDEPSFTGKVLAIHAGSVIVDAENIGQVSVTRKTTLPEGSPDVNVGDTVTVYFDGNIMETWPVQLGEVYAIVITERAPEKEVDTTEGFTMEAQEVGESFVAVKLTNSTEIQFYSGNEHDFGLQRSTEDGTWMDVPMLDGEFANTSEALIIMPGESEMTFDWAWRYGQLPEGHYRATKTFWGEDYFTSQVILTAEFDVK